MQFLNFAGPHAQGCFVVVAVVPFYVYAKAKVIQILPKYVSSNRMPHRNIQKEKDTEKSIYKDFMRFVDSSSKKFSLDPT